MPSEREIQQEIEIERLTRERDSYKAKLGATEKQLGEAGRQTRSANLNFELMAAAVERGASPKQARQAAQAILRDGDARFDRDGALESIVVDGIEQRDVGQAVDRFLASAPHFGGAGGGDRRQTKATGDDIESMSSVELIRSGLARKEASGELEKDRARGEGRQPR